MLKWVILGLLVIFLVGCQTAEEVSEVVIVEQPAKEEVFVEDVKEEVVEEEMEEPESGDDYLGLFRITLINYGIEKFDVAVVKGETAKVILEYTSSVAEEKRDSEIGFIVSVLLGLIDEGWDAAELSAIIDAESGNEIATWSVSKKLVANYKGGQLSFEEVAFSAVKTLETT